jgi:integrase
MNADVETILNKQWDAIFTMSKNAPRTRQGKSLWVNNDLVFPNELGWVFTQQSYIRALTQASRNAELPRLTPHDLRHTCASQLIKEKINIKVISKWLGHKDVATTWNTYIHLFDDDIEEPSQALAKAYSGMLV